MNFLQEHYRQLLNNWNFSKENRLVFQGGEGETAPLPVETEKKEEEKPAEAVPSSDEALGVADGEVKQAEKVASKEVKTADSQLGKLQDEDTSDKPEVKKPAKGKPEEPAKPKTEVKKPDEGTKPVDSTKKEPTEELKEKGKPEETAEQKAEKTKFIEDNLGTLMTRLSKLPDFKSLNSENPQMQEMAKELLAVMSKDKLEDLKKGNLDISEEEKGKMEKIAVSHIKKTIDKGDRIEKGEPELLDNWADKLDLSYENELEEGEPLNKLIALKFKIEKGDKGDEIKINGDVVKNKAELMAKITVKDSDLAEKLTNYENADENEKNELLKSLEKYAGDNVEAHEAMAKMAESLDSPEAIKKMGGLAGLLALLQLIPTIMEALKNKDFSVVNEMMADFKKGENPAKNISESKKSYDAFLKKSESPLSMILSAYEDPSTNNEVANNLFCKNKTKEQIKTDPLGKYRLMAKPAIQAHLARQLGLKITEIKTDEGGTEIQGVKRNRDKVSIIFYNEGGKLVADIRPYVRITEEGVSRWEIAEKGNVIKDAKWGTIKNELSKTVVATAPATHAPKPKPKPTPPTVKKPQ